MNESLIVGDLVYEIRRSSRRKTVGVTIDRDGALILHAPSDCRRETIESIGREKSLWVHTKLAERDLLFRPAHQREFVSGESFPYLGRSYRLLLLKDREVEAQTPALRLHEGRFKLRRDKLDGAQEHFRSWYARHAKPWIEQRVAVLSPRIEVKPEGVAIRDLGYRWASCGSKGVLSFNWCSICLPPGILEYLIVHELVHLREPHHTPEFWSRVERVIPNYERRKRWLAEEGGRYAFFAPGTA